MKRSLFKRFDHVSVAVEDIEEGYEIFRDRLGGRVIREKTLGYDGSFSWTALKLGGVMLELVQPEGEDSFLHKFLKGGRSKIHHLTFEVEDLEDAIQKLKERGFKIVGKSTADPEWNISFIHPTTAKGVLIEIFESKVKK
jgi:methylmalonyl-CoA/ethylmalonyl-CoA epimerase